MVYCGKPSRGCQMCRTRRIKCDETKPTCNQCAKSRRVCPGYKDEFDLVFRNETQATERRARKANRKAMQAKMERDGTSSSASSSPATEVILLKKSPSPEQAMLSYIKLDEGDTARCHFMSNYVLIPRQGTTRGYMEYIIPILKAEGHPDHFQLALDACSLASLGNRVGPGSDLEKQALSKYTRALSTTFKALQDPEQARADATLASVLLLGLFESITAKQIGMLAWGSHTEGAVQLLRQRGKKQLRTKNGLVLFIAVRTQMIIHTLSTGKAPVMGEDWWFGDAIGDEHASRCQRHNIRAAELRADVNSVMTIATRTPETSARMLELIQKCKALDQECVDWQRTVPEYFRYRSVAWEDHVPQGDYTKADVYPGRVDAYQDLWVASVWNMMRCSRIIISSLIVRCAAWVCAPVDYRTTPEYATAARTVVDIITDIIASVPYQLGWFSKRPHLLEEAQLSSFGCGEEGTPKGLPGYFLTWPLTCVQGQDYATDAQRAWVKGRLQFIADQLGVRYAAMLIQLNVRIPSMLIRRDGLMATPYPMAHDFEKLLSARQAPPSRGYAMNPLLQHEAMHRARVDQQSAELLHKAIGSSGSVDEFMARRWLRMENPALSKQHPQQQPTTVRSTQHE